MKLIVQRVKKASILINSNVIAKINEGLVIFVGITLKDNNDTMEWITNKIVNLRIFNDEQGKMNRSILDIENGGLLIVSNFTIYGDCKKGYRPSYSEAANSEFANKYFNDFLTFIKNKWSDKLIIENGIFGANMQIELINDGPVTIIIDK